MGYDFYRGTCHNCNNYSLFMLYSNSGYPEWIYYSSCKFELNDIDIDKYRICPECGGNSLLYHEAETHGICTWYNCCSQRDGGIPIEMTPCEECEDYVIEGECSCGYSEYNE